LELAAKIGQELLERNRFLDDKERKSSIIPANNLNYAFLKECFNSGKFQNSIHQAIRILRVYVSLIYSKTLGV
jgi:hypothetical protein